MSYIKNKFAALKKAIKRNKNSQFPIFLCAITIGYLLFFTSRSWMPDYGKSKAYSPMDTMITLDNRNFTLKNWEYSVDQSIMEIEIDVANQNFDNIDNYLFSCRDKKYEPLKVEPIIEDNNLLVVHILNVPPDFKELSFRIKVDYGEATKEVGDMVRFYTNRDNVSYVDEITSKTSTQYYITRLERTIKSYQNSINLLLSENDELSNKITLAKNDIETIDNHMQLLSADEVIAGQKQKDIITEKITDFEIQITKNDESIFDLEDKITEAQAKLNQWKNNNKG